MVALRHPFIINLVSTFQDEQCIYMVLEIVPGGELYSILHTERSDCIPESNALFYAACVAEGLAYMHTRSYVYRDLKVC